MSEWTMYKHGRVFPLWV